MPIWPTSVLPRRVPQRGQKTGTIQVARELLDAAGQEPEEVLRNLQSAKTGLSAAEAERRRQQHGPNVVGREELHPHLQLFMKAVLNPLVILLLVLAAVSMVTGDFRAGFVMLLMVVLGVVLRFVQETRADNAAAKLRAMISVRATVVRDGKAVEEPVGQLVPGDVVELSAGDMVPADVRVLSCKDLFITQATMTGESFPVEKFAAREDTANRSPTDLKNVCYLGTSVESGSASAVVVATGMTTLLGGMAKAIVDQSSVTSFDRGVAGFTWLMIRFMIVMVPMVFIINALTKTVQADEGDEPPAVGAAESPRETPASEEGVWGFLKERDWWGAFTFALAVAVGLTPEMLPMIVSVCLSKGALAMSRKQVIVKRLNSIQNLGAMDILCTDKTGTLTMDHIILEKYCDVVLQQDNELLNLAYLNSYFQTGLKNLLDRAVLNHTEMKDQLNLAQYTKADEIPFDFSRRVMSVVVQLPNNKHRLICKGAPEEVYRRCTKFELDGEIFSIEHITVDL
jgi:Mg2+-importing ATPase